MTEPLIPNIPLLRDVLTQVDTVPGTWDQRCYVSFAPCGTAHCIAGWTLVRSGRYEFNVGLDMFVDLRTGYDVTDRISSVAVALLGITFEQAWSVETGWGLFARKATREWIQTIAEKLAAEAGVSL